jgi:putative transport protein
LPSQPASFWGKSPFRCLAAQLFLGVSGGPLISGLIFGHFGHFGPVSVTVRKMSCRSSASWPLPVPHRSRHRRRRRLRAILQEYGIMLFIYGPFMTLLPMVAGYLLARYVMRSVCLTTWVPSAAA